MGLDISRGQRFTRLRHLGSTEPFETLGRVLRLVNGSSVAHNAGIHSMRGSDTTQSMWTPAAIVPPKVLLEPKATCAVP